jgi:hypothetical protein
MAIKINSTTVINDSRQLVSIASASVSGNIDGGNVNLADGTLSRPYILDYAMYHNALGSGSGSRTIDLTLGNYVSATVTGVTTWTFSNPPASARAGGFVLELTNGGSATQNWPAGVTKWPGGTAPTLTASGVDVLTFITDDGGTTWRGMTSMLDSK